MRFIFALFFFVFSIDSYSQSYVYEPLSSGILISSSSYSGNYQIGFGQVVFTDSKGIEIKCLKQGKIFQYTSSNESGTFQVLGKNSVVFESNKGTIVFTKQGMDIIIESNGRSWLATKIGKAYTVTKEKSMEKSMLLKLGFILCYNMYP